MVLAVRGVLTQDGFYALSTVLEEADDAQAWEFLAILNLCFPVVEIGRAEVAVALTWYSHGRNFRPSAAKVVRKSAQRKRVDTLSVRSRAARDRAKAICEKYTERRFFEQSRAQRYAEWRGHDYSIRFGQG